MRINLILAFLLSSVIFFDGYSQSKKETRVEKKAVRKAKKQKKLDEGKFMITPVAAPGYTPELGGLIAVGGLASFKTDKSDTVIQRSSLPFTIGYTSTGAVIGQAILTSYWFEDRLRIFGDFWYKNMPDHYWGVGYENGVNVAKSDSTTAYTRQWWWINPRFLYQFKPNYFVGLNIDYNSTEGSSESFGVDSDSTYQLYNNTPMNGGVGVIARYDSRDIPVDARKGIFIDLRGTFYSDVIGSQNNYQVYQLDYRQFHTINKDGHVLAWQMKTRISNGEVPYGEMSQLGTPFDLRGYQWGRFRDNNMFYFLTEYRNTFYKKNGEMSKHAAVVWMGSGTVFNEQQIRNNDLSWLPNFGIGYRLEVQPRMNLRLDYGIGRESTGIYFNFNQAF
ncbi:MAG: BamA/TamA family outer membrane protein [Salibacteraceae bacterium]